MRLRASTRWELKFEKFLFGSFLGDFWKRSQNREEIYQDFKMIGCNPKPTTGSLLLPNKMYSTDYWHYIPLQIRLLPFRDRCMQLFLVHSSANTVTVSQNVSNSPPPSMACAAAARTQLCAHILLWHKTTELFVAARKRVQ